MCVCVCVCFVSALCLLFVYFVCFLFMFVSYSLGAVCCVFMLCWIYELSFFFILFAIYQLYEFRFWYFQSPINWLQVTNQISKSTHVSEWYITTFIALWLFSQHLSHKHTCAHIHTHSLSDPVYRLVRLLLGRLFFLFINFYLFFLHGPN